MLNCRDLAKQADRYLDGELPLWDRLEVRLHMFLCQHCSRYVAQLRLAIATLRRSANAGQSQGRQEEQIVSDLLSTMQSEHCRHSAVYEETAGRLVNVRESGSAVADTAPSEVLIYTTPWCPYCRRAKALLRRKEIPFREIDVASDPARRQEMTALAVGRTTVPQIFIGGRGIGGCDELYALDAAGELERLRDRV